MKRVLVLCENPPGQAQQHAEGEYDQHLELRAFVPPRNVRFQSLGESVYESLSPLAADLARVGAYVYSADRLVRRGELDVFGQRWSRSFTFVIPVSDPDLWNTDAVKANLQEALRFLSEDQYDFIFVRGGPYGQGESTLFQDERLAGAESVALFSGGLDSLSGAVWGYVTKGQRPVLVSHRAANVVDRRQRALVDLLRSRLGAWEIMHAPAWVSFIEPREQEPTQRSRSFLYLSLAAAVAQQLGITAITVYENGVVSTNLPISAEIVGARVTRTTHPRFLRSMTRFLRSLLKSDLMIETPFLWLTKKEVALKLAEVGHPDLITASTSCSHTFMMSKIEPHCGVCSQCLDRRIALDSAGLAGHDTRYRHDMFTSALGDIEAAAMAKGMVLGFIRTHLTTDSLTLEQFVERYPQVYDVADGLGTGPEEVVERVYDLYRRQSADVRAALLRADERTSQARIDGLLPVDCLLRMLYDGEHRRNPVAWAARAIARIAQTCLPRAFAGKQPSRESEVRDALDSQLLAAREDIRKESPFVAFSVVKQVKPDLSAIGGHLFIEVKYPRPSRALGEISDEIAADITEYGDAGAAVLFVVYDPHRTIVDRVTFAKDLEKHDAVFACVV